MNRTLLYLVLTILVAGWLGHLIAKDPGYVLLSYDGATLQTSLWFLCGAVVATLVLLYFVMKLVRLLISTGGSLTSWKQTRKHSKALSQTTTGIVNLIEGNWAKARDLLVQSAPESPTPLINYLAAAKASDQLGDSARREQLLAQVRQRSSGAESAIAIFQARLAAASGDWQKVISLLSSHRPTSVVTGLRMEACLKLEDWAGAKELLPQFKKMETAEKYGSTEGEIWAGLVRRAANQPDTLQLLWKQLPGTLKHDALLLTIYTESLLNNNEQKNAETLVRKAINANWQPALVRLYGSISAPDKSAQIKAAQSWLKEHENDAALLLCLGQLYLSAGDEEKAGMYLEQSKSIEVSVEVLKLLGKLEAKGGNMAASNELYQRALEIAEGRELR